MTGGRGRQGRAQPGAGRATPHPKVIAQHLHVDGQAARSGARRLQLLLQLPAGTWGQGAAFSPAACSCYAAEPCKCMTPPRPILQHTPVRAPPPKHAGPSSHKGAHLRPESAWRSCCSSSPYSCAGCFWPRRAPMSLTACLNRLMKPAAPALAAAPARPPPRGLLRGLRLPPASVGGREPSPPVSEGALCSGGVEGGGGRQGERCRQARGGCGCSQALALVKPGTGWEVPSSETPPCPVRMPEAACRPVLPKSPSPSTPPRPQAPAPSSPRALKPPRPQAPAPKPPAPKPPTPMPQPHLRHPQEAAHGGAQAGRERLPAPAGGQVGRGEEQLHLWGLEQHRVGGNAAHEGRQVHGAHLRGGGCTGQGEALGRWGGWRGEIPPPPGALGAACGAGEPRGWVGAGQASSVVGLLDGAGGEGGWF
jgi:hypothetical protein